MNDHAAVGDTKGCVLTNCYADMGGGEFLVLRRCQHLIERDVSVRILLFQDGPLAERLMSVGCDVKVRHERLGCGPRGAMLKRLSFVPWLRRSIAEVKSSYVMVYTIQELPFVIAAAKGVGCPVFYRDQAAPASEGAESDWRERDLPSLVRKGVTAVFPTTQSRADDLMRRGIDPDIVRLVRLGVPAVDGEDCDQARQEVRGAWGCCEENVVVGVFGRLVDWKGQDVLIRAMRDLPDSTKTVIVGGPQLNRNGEEYVAYLHRLVAKMGLGNRVVFTGYRDNVAALMSACDIVCHTSWKEPFGLVVVEAMMAGRPVIATDVSGPRESVVDGETGLLYEPGDVSGLVSCIQKLSESKQLRQEMGRRGCQRAMRLFGVERAQAELDVAIAQHL